MKPSARSWYAGAAVAVTAGIAGAWLAGESVWGVGPGERASVTHPAAPVRSGSSPDAGQLKLSRTLGETIAEADPRKGGDFFVSAAFAAIASSLELKLKVDERISVPLARSREIALASLDTGWIAERRADDVKVSDLFQHKSWYVAPPPPPPPPPVAPPPPPPPQAPPLPFRYLGRIEESPDRVTYYLTQGERLVVVAVGDTIDNTYRVESAQNGQMTLNYLPLEIKQSLHIGAAR